MEQFYADGVLFTSNLLQASQTRTESDAFGEIQVPSDKYWGAQTERYANIHVDPNDITHCPYIRRPSLSLC